MLAVKAYAYGKLSTDATLLTLVGTTDHIIDKEPEIKTVFPLVIYREDNQLDTEYRDNKSVTSNVRIVIDIYVKNGVTTAIGIQIAKIFNDLYFHCELNGEVPDPDSAIRHRHMSFSRALVASDLT